ncbi:MAG TPA: TraR/DksA C4-type zinc finger protein [Desulfovibrio sp.]|jgi:phage/conjugal plasmid C-4 type zinc finger TraR family protein|uniref:TraR/DksA C4-type zinc finger protein n=1 Tax=Desulfovibrio TaxID=872 RepID=UPI00041EE311|nr:MULTISPECIES: TraR/DksA C4-type zinc finger protein [Desulfovibrio]MDY0306720.1 TraR/DksA C4-type zinc finger protein [Desulfovibrionaceae bacterium]HMM39071.1 TraR/DksA C4-type zinc finger protein [Desulfovibrio sp.]
MADEVDMAQQVHEREVAAAISLIVHRREDEGPEYVDGVPCCRDCGDPIPARRLAALPGIGRCVACQELADRAA